MPGRHSPAPCPQAPAMSALLEIKSSVLRQVQVCPSFRRRTEEELGSAGADPQEPTAAGAWWVSQEGLCPRTWGALWPSRCDVAWAGGWS